MRKLEAEGGCGVIGLAATEKVAGKHLMSALRQMENRGNGKGGGIAAVGLQAEYFGVSSDILDNDYIFTIGYLDPASRKSVERNYIEPIFDIDHIYAFAHAQAFCSIKDLKVKPPDAICYFVRVKDEVIQRHQKGNPTKLSPQAIADQIVYETTYRLNKDFYAAVEKKAFVLSNGKNMLVLKMVGFGHDVIRYYQLENFKAHVWIGHHRYPTKGREWHPGGAHPFIGLNEALVHNGDFANYFSICEYLAQRNIHPLFLTDTEVSALVFDLLYRQYQYPLEYVIEALAPTTERDFTRLANEKQQIYKAIQKTHMHASPDGPWFFLISQSLPDPKKPAYRLIGITDTSMLRPQVFALQTGNASIGLAASEKQAIDATLLSLSEEGTFWSRADYYWNARGGSYTDGGSFLFTVQREQDGTTHLSCTNKFDEPVYSSLLKPPYTPIKPTTLHNLPDLSAAELQKWALTHVFNGDYAKVTGFLNALTKYAVSDQERHRAFEVITFFLDRHYPTELLRRSSMLSLLDESLSDLATGIAKKPSQGYAYLEYKGDQPQLQIRSQKLIIDACHFPSDGENSLARKVVHMYKKGFTNFILVNCRGQRFIGNGLGPQSDGVVIDVYGSSGDYLASGIGGACLRVHGNGQDQLAQIMLDGKLIVYGDVGQTFMYGAKGGTAFILGNAAGRPLINAVGKPRVVINGTCLDYLAESFMAGNALAGGGFVIVNGIRFDEEAKIVELDTPYPGSNLFSLASGGAIYIRDPARKIDADQLNGGIFTEMTIKDWELILPYLEENQNHFNIPISRLLMHKGNLHHFSYIYRKIVPAVTHVLHGEEYWLKGLS